MIKIVGLLVAAAFAVLVVTSQDADAAKPCTRRKFETKLVADACTKGGQEAAKTAMKDFIKVVKKKQPTVGCPTCHAKVGGDYPLKPDGLATFKKFGGE